MRKFLSRHADKVTGVLSGFDRLVFRGRLLPLCHEGGVRSFLASQGVLLKQFGEFVEATTRLIRDAAVSVAQRAGVAVQYLESSRTSKEQTARGLLAERPIRSGVICMLSAVEPCSSWQVRRSKDHAHPQQVRRRATKCLHYYSYFQHPDLGFCHVRLQTWMPYTVQICLNGREWLGRQLDRARMSYVRAENCFPHLANPQRAQEIFDGMLAQPWSAILDGLVARANPFIPTLFDAVHASYYWTIHQSEWATDVMFRDAKDLAVCSPQFVRHAMSDFRSDDVLRFLGKRLHPCYRGEVLSDYKHRAEGIRVKHVVGFNSIKMYDKAHAVRVVRGAMPAVLRVEGTVNDPSAFTVRRKAQGQPDSPAKPRPLRKGLADTRRRAALCQAANNRYLDALAAVDDATRLSDILAPVTRPAALNGRRVRALRPFADADMALLQAISRGEYLLNGFRNRDLAPQLFPESASTPDERRKRSAKVSYRLRILRGHGVISRVPGTHRYQVTAKGRQLITAILAANAASIGKLKQSA